MTQIDIDSFRETFCEAAYELYVREGYAAVTMRGIAKSLGCSPMMAYRYFKNTDDVFASLRALRFHDLAQTLEDVPGALSPVKYLRELGAAYAGFAHKAPHAYRLLYTIQIHQLKTNPEVVEAQRRTKKVLFDATRRLVVSGDIQGDPLLLAHTIIAIIALVAGFYTLAINKIITLENRTGQIYLVCTFLAAVSALMIYNQGGFGPAHILAVLTLLALFGGIVVGKIPVFSKIADYFQAFCFSGTLLFHMIPAITDGLLRLPVGDPFLTNKHDPILRNFYLLFVVIFLVGYVSQFIWLKKRVALKRGQHE